MVNFALSHSLFAPFGPDGAVFGCRTHLISCCFVTLLLIPAELMEDHIRNHMPRNSKSSEEAADGVIQIVRTYLK